MVWKNQYYEDTIKSSLQIKFNPNQISNTILYRKNNVTLFEAQKSSNNQRNTVQKLVISIVQTLRQLF